MAIFRGTLKMAGDADSLPAVVTLDDGKLSLTASRHRLGSWPVDRLQFSSRSDGIHLLVEGEEIVLTLGEAEEFARSLSASGTRAVEEGQERARLLDRVSWLFNPYALGGIALLLLGIFATWVLALLVLIVGGVVFFAGLLALFDPFMASRLPAEVTPMLTLIAGTGLIVVSALIYAIS